MAVTTNFTVVPFLRLPGVHRKKCRAGVAEDHLPQSVLPDQAVHPGGLTTDKRRARSVRSPNAAFIVTCFDRMSKARLKRAKAHADIMSWANIDRNRARILIGEGVKDDIWKFRFQSFGNSTDKRKIVSGSILFVLLRPHRKSYPALCDIDRYYTNIYYIADLYNV